MNTQYYPKYFIEITPHLILKITLNEGVGGRNYCSHSPTE